MIAMLLFSFSWLVLSYCLHYDLHCPATARGQDMAPSSSWRAGATPPNFGRLKTVKRGVAPAQSGDFFCVTFLILMSLISSFARDLCASQSEEDGEDEAEVRNSYLLHRPRQNSRRAYRKQFLVGLERSTIHFGQGTLSKSRVAPAQHGVLPASKLGILPCASSSPSDTCSVAKVNGRVIDGVNGVFRAAFTFPGCK